MSFYPCYIIYMRKIISLKKLVLITLLLPIVFSACSKSNAEYFESMDTFMKVQCYGKNSKQANDLAQKRIQELETLISVTKPESDIYKINNATEYPVTVSPETINVIKEELKVAKMSDGALNPVLYPITKAWGFTTKQYRVPSDEEIEELKKLTDYNNVKISGNKITVNPGMMFDLGAVGKGFAGDEAIKILKENGISSAILDLGGNVQTIGSKPDGSAWQVGIQNPWGTGAVASVSIKDSAVITSGGYVRYFVGDDGKKYIHIMDGSTGRPVENDIISSTIVAKTGTYGDALSTATFVLGKEKSCAMWKKYKNFEMILLLNDHSICYTKGLEGKIELTEQFEKIEVIK